MWASCNQEINLNGVALMIIGIPMWIQPFSQNKPFDKGGGGVGEMLILADKGGRGDLPPPPIFADVFVNRALYKPHKKVNML